MNGKRFDSAQKFCEGAFKWRRPFKWFGKTGVVALDGDRRVRLDLITRGTQGHFEGFLLTILDKNTGVITSKRMWFKDYMQVPAHGCDSSTTPRVIDHCGWDWYSPAVPTKPFTDAVEGFVQMFE